MHDPQTVAHEITLPFKNKHGSRIPFITIWHVDPESDGTDDSCGWFKRSHHGDPAMLKKIRAAIEFQFDSKFTSDESKTTYYTGYFSPNSGMPQMSTMGIVLDMFNRAAWEFFKYNRKRHKKWMRENLYDILHFAENTSDSLMHSVQGTFRTGTGEKWRRDDSLNEYSSIIYGWLIRSNQKWYKHPRWHVHHWRFQFHPWQQLKRRYWDMCYICGKRGYKGAAYSDGTGRYHYECKQTQKAAD